MKRILIAPVGLYIWRVLRGIKEYRPDKIYLLLAKEDRERPEWHTKVKENTKLLEDQLGYTYKDRIEPIYVNFTDFKDVFKSINTIIQKHSDRSQEQDRPEFFIDITSTPLLPKIALISVAAIHSDVVVYYTPPKERQPKEYRLDIVEKDEGQEPVSIPVMKSKTYEELQNKKLYKDILVSLKNCKNHKVPSLTSLLDLVNLDTSTEKSRYKNYMLLGRSLRSLESLGLVVVNYSGKKEKEVELTILGDSLAECLVSEKRKE